MERKKPIGLVESLPPKGIFYPSEFYKNKLLYTAQGRETVNEESILRAQRETDHAVKLVINSNAVVVLDGNHRVAMALFCKKGVAYEIVEDNLRHIYSFHKFYNEFKKRLGRLGECL